MPIITGQLSIGQTPVPVNQPSVTPLWIHVHNNDNTNNLLIGGHDVTNANGLILPKLDSIETVINPNEVIYLLASSGTIQASYMVRNA
jgi:hypothetical protein